MNLFEEIFVYFNLQHALEVNGFLDFCKRWKDVTYAYKKVAFAGLSLRRMVHEQLLELDNLLKSKVFIIIWRFKGIHWLLGAL